MNTHTAGHKNQHSRQHRAQAIINSTNGLILFPSSGWLGWKPVTGTHIHVWVPLGAGLRQSAYPCAGSWVFLSPVTFFVDTHTHMQMGLYCLHGVFSGWPGPPCPSGKQAQTFWSLQHLAPTYDCSNTWLPGQLPSSLAVQLDIGQWSHTDTHILTCCSWWCCEHAAPLTQDPVPFAAPRHPYTHMHIDL